MAKNAGDGAPEEWEKKKKTNFQHLVQPSTP